MKKWTDDFLSQCLDGLPKDKYRKRAQDELTDHLLELASDLESGGYSPEEVQTRALELMGNPEELNPAFRAEWVRRASRIGYCLGRMFRWAFYGLLMNAWIRGMIFLPSILFSRFFESLIFPFSLTVFLFRIICFLPGLWFAVHNVQKDFSLFPRHRKCLLSFAAPFVVWLLDLSPVLLTFLIPPLDDVSFFLVFFAYIPLIVLDGKFFKSYLITQAVLCVMISFFYCIKFIRSNKK